MAEPLAASDPSSAGPAPGAAPAAASGAAPGAPPGANPAGGSPGQASWRALLGAGEAGQAAQAWLDLAVILIGQAVPGGASGAAAEGAASPVLGAFVALRQEGARYGRAATHGEGTASFLLAKAAERCLQLQRTVVQNDEAAGAAFQLALPLMAGYRLEGVVAFELSRAALPQLDRVTRLLQWGLGWFGRGAPGEAGTAAAPAAEWLELLTAGADLATALEAVCSLLAGQWAVGRVSIGLGRAGRLRLRATSRGRLSTLQTEFILALAAAMEEAVESGAPLCLPPREGQVAAIGAHQRLCRAHGVAWAATFPVPLSPQGASPPGRAPWMALTVEGEGAPPAPEQMALWQGVAARLAPVLALRGQAERGLLGHAGAALGAALGRPGRLWKPALALAAAGALLGLALLPVPFRVNARATLEGSVKRSIAAPFDGYLAEALARPGDRVAAGTLLARMEDRELRLQRLDYEGRLVESRRQADEAIGRRDMATAGIATARRMQAEAELRLIDAHLARTGFVAPFDAIVIAGDPSQSIGAPLRRGEVVYELSPLDDYRVTLEVEEGDFAAIAAGQQGRLVLASLPYGDWPIRVTAVTPLASARDGRNSFRVEARLEQRDAALRPGMQGIGKVEAGTAPLAWVWGRSALAWARLKLWAWLP
ncbi:HlyD family efflux transporter periplasmic adaptor subunit [Roseomonas sp. GC11]|uniref:efflux RND transporter periplasmic adaptor subunit n=1 Tax=Roseomonas sp. GC11 TaxID=2950546 RepID=UPI00210F2270|nr:HlyD family efflux transporter periplasmic adaptor subunit [Roseomonas sp. GC11]MCQ4159247.1 HlyD family efflux transporter periplasmic adaptor subunit [Roseomonas sp. GC11]